MDASIGTIAVKKKSKIKMRRLALTLLALPFVIHILTFAYVPLFGWIFAFYRYRPGIPLRNLTFVGLDNFRNIFIFSNDIIRVLTNTLALAFLGILMSPLPVIVAILLNEIRLTKFKRTVQTITTIPNFISWVIVYSLAFTIFASGGLLNQFMLQMGFWERPYNILLDYNVVWRFQTALGIWKGLGWGAILYMAAISSIDEELIHAARVDGAGRFRCIWHITVPGVIPTYMVLMLLSISNLLSVGFEQYFVFSNPFVRPRIEVLDLYLFRIGIGTGDFSFAIAAGILRSFVSIVLLFTANALSKFLRGGESLI